MRLSFSTRGWAHLNWEEWLSSAVEMDFEGIEVYNLPKFPELMERSAPFGNVRSVRIDCTTAVITIDFTTASYDALIDWQRMITASSRFQLLEMPTFTTGGTSYAVSAKMTAVDFSTEGAD